MNRNMGADVVEMLTESTLARAIIRAMGLSSTAGQPTDPWIGLRIVGYRITRQIGQGGMGAVYEARHETLRRRAALKVLRLEQEASELSRGRFVREAKAASAVRHDNLIEIYNYGHLDEQSPYILMEFLEGESLKERLTRYHRTDQRLPLSMVVEIGAKVAAVLAVLHRSGIVHRDLKPANLMLVPWPGEPSGERLKVVDFGIAKLQDETADVMQTTIGRFVGTAAYASPEQCQMSSAVGPASDVYSLGITLYQMLAGQPPFWHNLPGLLLAMHQLHKPVPLRSRAPHTPPELCKLVERMLEKEPLARPSMEQISIALGALTRQPMASSRRPALARRLAATVTLLAFAGGAGGWLIARKPPRSAVHAGATAKVQAEGAAPVPPPSSRPVATASATPDPPPVTHVVTVAPPPGPEVSPPRRPATGGRKAAKNQAQSQRKPPTAVVAPATVATVREQEPPRMAAEGPGSRVGQPKPPPPLFGPP